MIQRRFMFGFFLMILMCSTFFSLKVEATAILDGQTPPVFEEIDRKSGLSNMSVSSIIQDKDGVLWFGTQGGLNRYDGRKMTTIRNNPFDSEGLIHNLIQTMTYDSNRHEIWIGTYQGLSRYNIYQNTFINYTVEGDGLSNPVIVSITFDAEGLAWIGTLDGLNSLNPDTGEVKNYPIEGDVVRSIFLASNDTLYIGTHEGLKMYDSIEDRVISTGYQTSDSAVMLIHENDPGILTLGLWEGGLMTINLNTGQIEQRLFADNRVYSYLKTSDGIEWIGTWGGGVFALEPDGNIIQFPGTLPDDDVHHSIIYSLYQDKSDILWIGTNGGGITKVNPLKRNYVRMKHIVEAPESISAGKNNLIFRDRYENFWTAIYNQGIERIDESNLTTIKYNDIDNNSLGDNVICYLDHPDWPLLVGGTGGISYYDVDADQFESYDLPIPEGSFIYALTVDQEGRLWIGTYRDGVYVYNPKDESIQHHNKEGEGKARISDNLVYSLLNDSKGRIWIGTNNGLNLIEPGQEKIEIFKKESDDRKQLPNNTVRKIFEDSNGDIWIATVGGGIAQYQEEAGHFMAYTEEDGLGNNSVVGILEDEHKRLWFSTLDGLSVLDLRTHAIFTLLPEDGIGAYEFNAGHFKDRDGSLYFGGAHGITVMPKNYKRLSSYVPTLFIDDFLVLGTSFSKDIPFYNGLVLDLGPHENFLNFNFVALDYDAPEKVTYFYRLLGQNAEFINNSTYNQASFSNLGPGTYTFEVYALTSRGIKTETVSMVINIDNHWYQSFYAYLLYISLILLLIYIFIKLRERNIMAVKNSELNKVNAKLADANLQLEQLSILDSMTGVFNRRHLDQIIDEQIKMAIRGELPIGLIMLDIDDFKSINDTYGHLIGDQVIIQVAECAKKALKRSTDHVFRYGGDEFLITLYDTDLEGVLEVVLLLKKTLSEHQISIPSQKGKIPIYLSIGIHSEIPERTTTAETIIKKADDALYLAKKQGKNCVVHEGKVLE